MEIKKDNIEKPSPKGAIRFSVTLSQEQKLHKEEILKHPVSFVIWKAGSGKTLLAVQIALDLYFKRKVNKIIITRPTVSTEDNGFLPGTEKEKMNPWLVPIKSNMRKVYNKPEILTKLEASEDIELVSLTHFRGRTFENCVCVVDEFQNLTRSQLLMAVTRLGKNSYMIFTGDGNQIDLRDRYDSAVHSVDILRKSKHVYIAELTDNHRHEAIDDILILLTGHT